jgi:hypothetical protein
VWRRVQRPLREIFAQWSVKVADAALVRWVRALSIVALAFGGAGRRHDLYIWRQGDDRAGGDSARLVLIASDGCSRPVCICMGSCLASLYLINHYNLASPPPEGLSSTHFQKEDQPGPPGPGPVGPSLESPSDPCGPQYPIFMDPIPPHSVETLNFEEMPKTWKHFNEKLTYLKSPLSSTPPTPCAIWDTGLVHEQAGEGLGACERPALRPGAADSAKEPQRRRLSCAS